MTITVTQAPHSKGLGRNLLNALVKHKIAVKVVSACGKIARLPLDAANDLAGKFSGYESKNRIGNMALDGTIKLVEATIETTEKLSISAIRSMSRSIAER